MNPFKMCKDITLYCSKYALSVALSFLPFSIWYPIYRNLQLKFGGLSTWNPRNHLYSFFKAFSETHDDFDPGKLVFFELGTGGTLFHSLLAFLLGFGRVVTVDAVDLVDEKLVKLSLKFLIENQSNIAHLASNYGIQIDPSYRKRVDLLEGILHSSSALEIPFIIRAIQSSPRNYDSIVQMYCGDLTMRLYIFSVDVFEHVSSKYLEEFSMFLARTHSMIGGMYHYIDISDHFATGKISRLSYLRINTILWSILSRNPYHYCNRLRPSDFIRVFSPVNPLSFECCYYDQNGALSWDCFQGFTQTYDSNAIYMKVRFTGGSF